MNFIKKQGRPLHRQVEANASGKKLRESKKSKIEENIFFVGKLPRNAWHRIRQFCVQQLHFFLFASLADYL